MLLADRVAVLDGGVVADVFAVDIPRPRSRRDERFESLRVRILEDLGVSDIDARLRAHAADRSHDDPATTRPEPRFGVWAPVYGTWGAHTHPDDPADASYARTRAWCATPRRPASSPCCSPSTSSTRARRSHEVLETWTAAAAVAEATERIEIIAAVKPLLFHPGVLAKLALAIDQISDGRFAINLGSAWFRPEMAQLGIEMPPHDERYVYSAEWLGVVRRCGAASASTTAARASRSTGSSSSRPVRPGGPTVYFGGESEPARALAAAAADVFFINGRPLADTAELIEDLRAAAPADAAAALRPLRVRHRAPRRGRGARGARAPARARRAGRPRRSRGADPAVAMIKVSAGPPRVGTNGGTLAGLVGSYDKVAERIAAFPGPGSSS